MTDTSTDNTQHGIILSERTYDVLKDLDLIALPALGTAYGTLATLYGWGFVPQVIGTVAVIVTLIGILLKISNVQYKAAKKVAVANLIAATAVAESPNQGLIPDPNTVIVQGGSQ